MKKNIYIYGILLLATMMISCQESIKEYGHFFGKQVAYRTDFLWSKYVPDTLKQTLSFEHEGIAYTQPITLGLYEVVNDSLGQEIENAVGDEIELYVDGKRCAGSTFIVRPEDNELTLGVVFVRGKAKERDYYWALRVVDVGDVDMINESLITNSVPLVLTWKAEYDTKTNPLKEGLIWLCIIIAALICLWLAALQWIVFPRFAFDNLQVVYMDGDNRKGREDCSLHGARKIICSANPKSQSALSRLFSGRIEYLTNQFWETPVVMTPCGSSGIAVGEELKAGNASTYRMSAMITPQNGPRRPFVIKKTRSDMTANISIG